MLTHLTVNSSNVQSVGYDTETQKLEVAFKGGGLYEYSNVPPEKWAGLMDAESTGKYLNSEIRGKFAATKKEPKEA